MTDDCGKGDGVMYRAMKPHASAYQASVIFRAGEHVRYENRESEWPGWVWCTSPGGEQAWVPEAWISIEPDARAIMLRDYNARELPVMPGDTLLATLEESGWVWCRTPSGQSGWVPLNCVEPVDTEQCPQDDHLSRPNSTRR